LAAIQARGSSNGTLAAAVAAAAGSDSEARDWADMYEDYLDAELEEDEEFESYYFSSAAGRARVVLGNRRWGEGGFMRAGVWRWTDGMGRIELVVEYACVCGLQNFSLCQRGAGK
jgi:hypothetical protein